MPYEVRAVAAFGDLETEEGETELLRRVGGRLARQNPERVKRRGGEMAAVAAARAARRAEGEEALIVRNDAWGQWPMGAEGRMDEWVGCAGATGRGGER